MKKILFTISYLFFSSLATAELLPENVAILANSNSKQSMEVAQAYLRAREVPEANLLALPLQTEETISREDYENLVLSPLKKELKNKNLVNKIKAIVTIFDVPLKIAAPANTPPNKESGIIIQEAIAQAKIELEELISNAQKVAGEKPDGFIEVPNENLPIEFQNLINRASAKLKTLSGAELEQKQQQLAQVVANAGGLSSLVQILRPIGNPEQQATAAKEIEKMNAEIKSGALEISNLEKSREPNDARKMLEIAKKIFGSLGVINFATKMNIKSQQVDADASFDSELSLLWWSINSYPLSNGLTNPLHHKLISEENINALDFPILMVSRIDAPDVKSCLKMINGALEAEQNGLKGKAYIDTRGLKDNNALSNWDKGLKDLGWYLRDNTNLDVEMDIYPELIEEVKDAAIYTGWYQLRKFQGDFSFKPGAIGWHIASEEAVSIHNKEEKGWCKNILERGAAVSLGAVAEPFLESFPTPMEFYGLLLSGRYSLVEAYYLTTRNLSWRLVLFGDPLYKPFKENKKIRAKDFGFKEFPIAPTSLKIKPVNLQ